MNALTERKQQLPDTLEDLSKFVLIGRERLTAVRASIRAIQKVGLAKEVHEQKLQEAQELAEAVLDAEVKIGELTAKIEKACADRGNQYTGGKSTALSNSHTKAAALEEIGLKQHTAERFEALARNPEAVATAKEKARKDGRVVTRQDVFNEAYESKRDRSSLVQQALDEHNTFNEQKKNGVVSIADAKRDKVNERIVVEQSRAEITKALAKVADLPTLIQLKRIDLPLMIRKLGEKDIQALVKSVQYAKKFLEYLEALLLTGGKE